MAADRFALVTGTTSGIGLATALALLARGWTVVGVGRRESAIAQSGYEHLSVDLSAPARARAAITSCIGDRIARADVRRVALVNNAARADLLGPLEHVDADALSRVFDLNVVTPVALMGAIVEHSRPGTAIRIVNVSSGAAVGAFPGLSAYGSSKAALRMAGMVLAAETAAPPDRGTTTRDLAILSYEPGTVDTPMQTATRSVSSDVFPWGGIFRRFASEGLLVHPEQPAAEIAAFLDAADVPPWSERRLGRS
jgi:hypothetical protein